MNRSELVAWVRDEATLSSKSTMYTPAKITQLMNQDMSKVFTPLIANARSGYWYHTFTRMLGTNNPYVRLPSRACPAIEQVDISIDEGQRWYPLNEALESEAQDWARESEGYNWPQAYTVRGSYLYLLNAARQERVQLRVKVTIKPSLIVEEQVAGQVLDVDTDTRIITLNSLPVNRLNNVQLNGNHIIDIIEPQGCYELSLCDAFASVIDPTHIEVAEGYSLARVEVGDYLRIAGQSDWPQLPEEFHSLLGSTTAVPICRQRDLTERAMTLADACSSALQRFQSHLLPRVRVDTHKPIQHQWR
jgi:hypothetical protein